MIKSNQPNQKDMQAKFAMKAHNLGAGGVNEMKYNDLTTMENMPYPFLTVSLKRIAQRNQRQARAMGRG